PSRAWLSADGVFAAGACGWPGAVAALGGVPEHGQRSGRRCHVSLRTFGRVFRQHTGMSYLAWRQRACVVLALARLAEGDPVTAIALDFGYQSPAAFSTMFRRVLGYPPTAYLRQAPAAGRAPLRR
ncbi:hypothetical protein CTI14_45295, partial [Methylobacterium radiotolerans]